MSEPESIALLMARREYGKVLPLLERDIQKHPANSRLRLQYADALNGLGRREEALVQYEETARTYDATGLVVQAIAVRKKAEALQPAGGVAPPPSARPIPDGPFFEVLSEEEKRAVSERLDLQEFSEGDLVISEGEKGTSMYVIASGEVNVYTTSPKGERVHLARLGEGDFFGEVSVLTGKPRTATISACGKTTLLRLDRDQLDAIVESHPRVRQVLEEVCRRRAEKTIEAMIDSIRNRSQ